MHEPPNDTLALARLAEDLALCNLAPQTQKACISAAREFLSFTGLDPDAVTLEAAGALTVEDFRRYMLHLNDRGLSAPTRNSRRSCIYFLYRLTLDKDLDSRAVPRARQAAGRFPEFVTLAEFHALMDAAQGILTKCFVALAFGCGLRAAEVAALRIGDIDYRKTGQIRVAGGAKGGKVRFTVLPLYVRLLLREACLLLPRGRRGGDGYIFPHARRPGEHVTAAAVSKAFSRLRDRCAVNPKVTFHSLRHGFAVSMLNHGCDPDTLRLMLGHASFATTARYLQASGRLTDVPSPLDAPREAAR